MEMLKQLSETTTGTLFPPKSPFRIVQIRSADAKRWTDEVGVLKNLITANQPMYPNIDSWFADKVIPGIKSSSRVAYVAYEGEDPIASAVLKLGVNAKFCHLRIHQDFQDLDLGQMFFTQMTLEARHHAKDIHFTLPESLWSNKRHFFESFGFLRVSKASRQYRHGDEELACSAPLAKVWSAVLEKLPRLLTKFSIGEYSLNHNLLMSVKPKYAESLLAGSKLVEIRRRFSSKWVGGRTVLYASRPLCALVGEATIKSVVSGTPLDVWSMFESQIGCSWEEFSAYVSSAVNVSAIDLADVMPYREPVPLSQLSHLLNEDLRPPQSYCDLKLEKDSAWGRAVSVASLLHGRFRLSEQR